MPLPERANHNLRLGLSALSASQLQIAAIRQEKAAGVLVSIGQNQLHAYKPGAATKWDSRIQIVDKLLPLLLVLVVICDCIAGNWHISYSISCDSGPEIASQRKRLLPLCVCAISQAWRVENIVGNISC